MYRCRRRRYRRQILVKWQEREAKKQNKKANTVELRSFIYIFREILLFMFYLLSEKKKKRKRERK